MMLSSGYKKKYIQSFYDDLNSILMHIRYDLKNPNAAKVLLRKVNEAIVKRMDCPTAYEPMFSKKHRELSYYRIYVSNITIYYVVYDDKVEFRRILYKRRDNSEL